MKDFKKMSFLVLFLVASSAIAQETPVTEEGLENEEQLPVYMQQERVFQRDTTYSEVHLNMLNLLVFGALDLGYERVLSDNTSAGVEIFAKVFNKNEEDETNLSDVYTKKFSITGKFKYFFPEDQAAWGYYAQVFSMFSNGTNEKEIEIKDVANGGTKVIDAKLDYTDLALGVGVGGKFVAKQGFLIDVSFGIGRNLFDKYSPDFVFLPSINVGYRF